MGRGYVWLCLGYGLCLSVSATGSVGLAYAMSHSCSLTTTLVAQSLFLLATTGVWLLFSRFSTEGTIGTKASLRRIGFVASLACLALPDIPQGGTLALLAWAVLFGAAISAPKLGWFECFLAVGKNAGRLAALSAIAASFAIALIPSCFLSLAMDKGVPLSVLMAALIGVMWLCQELAMRHPKIRPIEAEPPGNKARYGLTPYATTLLVSFGFTWGLGCNVLARLASSSNTTSGAIFVTGAALIVIGCAALPLVKRIPAKTLHYGNVIRCVIAAVGSSWAAVPLIAAQSVQILSPLFSVVFMLQGVLMTLLSVDICNEQGLAMKSVATINYAVFMVASAVATVIYLALEALLDGVEFYAAISLVATAAALVIIPILPSRSSQASSFTLKTYPEDEDYHSRVKAKREGLASRYGLSQRELEVAELLLDGKTRNEIAQLLTLSPWTVKTHIAGLYEKMGIHSVKELILKVTDGSAH